MQKLKIVFQALHITVEKYFFPFCYYFFATNVTRKSYSFFANFVLKGKKMRVEEEEEEKNKYLLDILLYHFTPASPKCRY